MIFDEATTALDVITQSQILKEIQRLKQEFDLTTIVISHDVGVINAVTDTVAVLYAGQLMEIAPRTRVLRLAAASVFAGADRVGAATERRPRAG